jgi:hypothetical protein
MTTIFLDVDGVLAPCRPGPVAMDDSDLITFCWDDWVDIGRRGRFLTQGPGAGGLYIAEGFPCHLSRKMGDALAALDADIVWLTTWEHLANEVISPFMGWHPFPFFRQADYSPPWATGCPEEIGWKFAAAEDLQRLTNGKPFIWVDDDIGRPPRVPRIGPGPAVSARPSLDSSMASTFPLRFPYALVSPESNVGLTPEQIEFMARMIEEWK